MTLSDLLAPYSVTTVEQAVSLVRLSGRPVAITARVAGHDLLVEVRVALPHVA